MKKTKKQKAYSFKLTEKRTRRRCN